MSDFLEGLFVCLAHRCEAFERFGAAFHGEFDECITRSGSRRRAKHLDPGFWQRSVDIRPHLVRVGDQLAAGTGNLLGKRQENLRLGQFKRRSGFLLENLDAVESDLDLHRSHAIVHAGFELVFLDRTRRVGEIRRPLAATFAEQLHAATGSGRFDHRGLAGCSPEFLGYRRGKGKHRRRTDNLDLVSCCGGTRRSCDCNRRHRHRENG